MIQNDMISMASSLIQTGPTPADKANTFIPFIPASLSILGTSAILYNILSDPRRRFTSPYFRIMFGLITADMISAITSMTSTFAAPRDTPFLYYAVGNQATCDAQGFFIHLGVTQPIYTACLAVYYLVTIKYNVSDDHIAKKYEVWMHAISILYPLVGSIVCVRATLFNPTASGCRLAEYPPKCDLTEKVTCLRGARAKIYVWIFTGVALDVSFGVIILCMGSIIFFVKRRERIMNRRFSFANNPLSQSKHFIKQSREVMVQGLFYVGSFTLVWIFSSVYTLSSTKPIVLLVLSQFFWPLQGFLNSLIYFWPRYIKTREEFKEHSFCWIVKDMIFTTTREKEQRRVVLHSIRRRRGVAISSARDDKVKGKEDRVSNSRHLTSLDLASSAVLLGTDDVVLELSSMPRPADMDGDPVVMLQRLRADSEHEAGSFSSEASSEKVDDVMIEIVAVQIEKRYGIEEDTALVSAANICTTR